MTAIKEIQEVPYRHPCSSPRRLSITKGIHGSTTQGGIMHGGIKFMAGGKKTANTYSLDSGILH